MAARLIAFSVLSLCLGFGFLALAEETAEDVPHWKGDVSSGLSLARGNARSSTLSLTFSAEGPISKNALWKNSGLFLLGEMNKETSAESLLVTSQIDWQHTKRFFSYYELQGIRDRFKNYSYRFLPTVGLGYRVIAEEKISLSLDTGLSQILTKYYDTGSTDSYTGLTIGQRLIWKIAETAELNEKVDLNSDVSELRHFFLRFEANLVAAIAKSWSVKLTFIDSYDNKPVGALIKKNDITFIAGISRKF